MEGKDCDYDFGLLAYSGIVYPRLKMRRSQKNL